jgi:hypothetical protein
VQPRLAEDARGRSEDDLAPEAPHAGDGEDESLPRPGHAHVAEASLLGQRLGDGVSIVGKSPSSAPTMTTVSNSSLSFAKSTSESRGDPPCSYDRPGEWWAR